MAQAVEKIEEIKQKISDKIKNINDENVQLRKEKSDLETRMTALQKELEETKKDEIQELKAQLQPKKSSDKNGTPEVAIEEDDDDKDDEEPKELSSSGGSPSTKPASSTSSDSSNVARKRAATGMKTSGILLAPNAEMDETLREAARRGQTERIRQLLVLGVDVNSKDDSGYTALHWAAINGRSECLDLLIRSGADVNISDHGGWSPLHYASYKGHVSCVQSLLIQPNIDIEAKNSAKKTPSQVATKKEISSLLKDAKDSSTRLLLERSKNFWTAEARPGNSNGIVLPEEVKKKEQELIDKERALLEREQLVGMFEGELQLLEQTISKKQKEEASKREDLTKKEKNLTQLEDEVRKKLEIQGERELGDQIFIVNMDEIKIISELGSGTFGSVYKANWKGDLVAVKKLKAKIEDVDLIKAFQAETYILAKMRHPNILTIMGAVCRAPDLVIITELMKCDLGTLLYSKEKIEWNDRILMAMDIARGMNYIHNLNMIHRDLKSNNLLVDEQWRVKISDFGTAIAKDKMGTEIVGTAAWMSPERLLGELSDEKTDVFSFGVVMWELLNRKQPWEGLSNIQIIARVGHAGERLTIPDQVPKGCPPIFVNIIKDSFSNKRPSFESILQSLREIAPKK